ncbi:MAG: hypothetical protein ACFCGT_19990 [Sandaracinaceae bacterium]
MSAVRQSDRAGSSIPEGAYTRLLREALEAFVSPERRDELLAEAGWDAKLDRPEDPRMTVLDLVEGPLFARLAEGVGLVHADEARRHLRTLLQPSSNPPKPPPAAAAVRQTKPLPTPGGRKDRARAMTEPDVVVPSPEPEETPSSPVASGRRDKGGTIPTFDPGLVGQILIVWSGDPRCAKQLESSFPTYLEIRTTAGAEELASLLNLYDGRPVLILLDRRTAAADDELRQLPAWTFVESRVVVWGAPEDPAPGLDRLLDHADKAVACSAEAQIADVAHLCAHLMGHPHLT